MANKVATLEEQARRAVSLACTGNLGAGARVLVSGQVQNHLDGCVDEALQRLHPAGDTPSTLWAPASPDMDEALVGKV